MPREYDRQMWGSRPPWTETRLAREAQEATAETMAELLGVARRLVHGDTPIEGAPRVLSGKQ